LQAASATDQVLKKASLLTSLPIYVIVDTGLMPPPMHFPSQPLTGMGSRSRAWPSHPRKSERAFLSFKRHPRPKGPKAGAPSSRGPRPHHKTYPRRTTFTLLAGLRARGFSGCQKPGSVAKKLHKSAVANVTQDVRGTQMQLCVGQPSSNSATAVHPPFSAASSAGKGIE